MTAAINAFLDDLAGSGKYHFTAEDYAKTRSLGLVAARAALRRASERGSVAMPARGFWVIVPPEYRALSCLPAEQFIDQLMKYLGEPYYVALLSAARYHGAAHQAPQIYQVMLAKNRRPLHCGKVGVEFMRKETISACPAASLKTSRGLISVSTPEVTALDLVGYYRHCGGLDHVATVLSELKEKVQLGALTEVLPISPVQWVQRLGVLFDMVGAKGQASRIRAFVKKTDPPFTALQPGLPVNGCEKNSDFRVAINTEIEPDL